MRVLRRPAGRAAADRPAVRRTHGAPGRPRVRADDGLAHPHAATGMTYETVIGLEIHVQLLTASKMFCACAVSFGAPPNTLVCPVCVGLPGSLPVVNRRAVELGLRTGVALGCTVHPISRFHRKNYYYPDLPKNYQITQYQYKVHPPLATDGWLEIASDGARRRV